MIQNNTLTRRASGLVRRIQRTVIEPAKRPFFIDTNSDYRNSIFLAGAERSGTTWLSELINYDRSYRYIFEPFWALHVPQSQAFRWQQYLRPENDDPERLRAATAILSGRIRNAWADKYHRRFVASERLVKDIRTNLMLKWLRVHFPEMPMIFLLRHPMAVTVSLMRREIRWGLDLQRDFLDQPLLVEDFLLPFQDEIKRAESDFERFIFRWCIQNYIPLRQLAPDIQRGEVHVVFYENLCDDPAREMQKLFAFLGKPYRDRVLAQVDVPSPVSRLQSAVVSGDDLLTKWQRSVATEDIARAEEILALFGLDALYTGAPRPQSLDLAQWSINDFLI